MSPGGCGEASGGCGAGAVKTCLQQLEGRLQWWIYRVRRTGIAEEEKPRCGLPWGVMRDPPCCQAKVTWGGRRGLLALPSLTPGPWCQAEAHRPLQGLASSLPTLGRVESTCEWHGVLVGHPKAPPAWTGQGRSIFAGRVRAGSDTPCSHAVSPHPEMHFLGLAFVAPRGEARCPPGSRSKQHACCLPSVWPQRNNKPHRGTPKTPSKSPGFGWEPRAGPPCLL